jgi:hypothetical protein
MIDPVPRLVARSLGLLCMVNGPVLAEGRELLSCGGSRAYVVFFIYCIGSSSLYLINLQAQAMKVVCVTNVNEIITCSSTKKIEKWSGLNKSQGEGEHQYSS